jgi:hypothetical protein
VPENECNRPEKKYPYTTKYDTQTNKRDVAKTFSIHESYDNRPLECRLFPFDVKKIEDKLTWVKWNGCHATPKLDYENFIGFFERKFFREFTLEQIRQYAESQESSGKDTVLKKGYSLIRELKWPTL